MIERAILLIRGEKVMLDADLAALYSVSTKRLNEQVKRNVRRFPADFMFRLTSAEVRALRSQFATSKPEPEGVGVLDPTHSQSTGRSCWRRPARRIGFQPNGR